MWPIDFTYRADAIKKHTNSHNKFLRNSEPDCNFYLAQDVTHLCLSLSTCAPAYMREHPLSFLWSLDDWCTSASFTGGKSPSNFWDVLDLAASSSALFLVRSKAL